MVDRYGLICVTWVDLRQNFVGPKHLPPIAPVREALMDP